MDTNKQEFSPKGGILCVGGSPRKGGNSDVIAETLSARLEQNKVPVEMIRLREHDISPCIGCEGCRKDHVCRGVSDDMQSLYPQITAARGMVLISPTHHYNITAWMKAFIDRMYCFYRFGNDVPRTWSSCLAGQARIAAVIAVCEQKDRQDMGFTLEAMKLPLEAFGYKILADVAIFKIFEKAGVRSDTGVMERLAETADKMADAYKALDRN